MENKTIFSEMWDAYKRTILHSIITSFGLDFLIRDQNGGDVDTIRGVRETGQYKNQRNADAYNNRGDYDSVAYHNNDAYSSTVRAARDSNEFFDDAYVPGNRIFYGKASGLGSERKANLDHVISANEIHNDPGRVLADLDGVELANQSSNLKFTNEHLNKSMKDMTIEEYIQWRANNGDPLPEDVQAQMRKADADARQEYERRISKAYYTSDRFILDAGKAAAKLGAKMGLRQAIGFVFLEVWFACEKEIKELPDAVSFGDCLKAIQTGIRNGFEISKTKYKEILRQFGEGFISGALASLGTTLINVFITTDKNTVKYIRQISVIVIQTGDILLINPDDLRLGDQLNAAMVSVVTGASVLAGTFVGNQIEKTPLGKDERVGQVVQNFCAALVSGLLSCTILILIDRSKFMHDLIDRMNRYCSVDHAIRETSEAFIKMAAELKEYDIAEFQNNVCSFKARVGIIQTASDENLNKELLELYEEFDIPLPWKGDFDDFMGNKNNKLVFN